jgi:heme exporter protein D
VPFLRKAILPPVIAAVPAAATLILLRFLAMGGLAALGAWASAGMGIYVVLLWWIGFDTEERALVRTHLNRLVRDPADVTDWDDMPPTK